MRKTLLLALVFFTSITAFGQDFSNKGKDFWLCFPNHVPSGTSFATLSIFITSDRASTGTITMPNGAFSGTFNIAANGIQEIQIPWNANIHISNGESSNENVTNILNKSIRIKVDAGQPAVVAYAQQWAGARSAATLLLPVNVLGRKYFAVSFNQAGSNNGTYIARSQFQIIATKPNTVVEITPVKNGVKGTKYTVNLPLAGDMIQYQSPDAAAGTQDLTGTYIESVAGASGCLPIAVYSGSSNVTFGTQTPSCSGNSYDPLWQQLYPATTWGKNFGFIPFADYLSRGNPYRVMASEDNTNVYFNGALVGTLNAGQIYPAAFTAQPATLTAPTYITSDKPICVTQYAQADACTGQTGGGRVGDPDMVILNPIEQNISDITVFSSTRQAISK
ncbi:MAG TPA: IgGFc-binding protein, partial [Ferruginibacter sp.]|nr:IgGFc-binding protein [Ferruginibacter sp.]